MLISEMWYFLSRIPALLLQCESEINRAALMETPLGTRQSSCRLPSLSPSLPLSLPLSLSLSLSLTHTHTRTHRTNDVCAAFSADWAAHRMFCGAKNRNHLQSVGKKWEHAFSCVSDTDPELPRQAAACKGHFFRLRGHYRGKEDSRMVRELDVALWNASILQRTKHFSKRSKQNKMYRKFVCFGQIVNSAALFLRVWIYNLLLLENTPKYTFKK